MRKALIVGIDHYVNSNPLYGCVNDAHAVNSTIARHGDGTVNFDALLLTSSGPTDPILRAELKDKIRELFADDSEIALFYFAGHGHIETTGGYLLTSESVSGDDGVPLGDVLTYANQSKAKNRIIILDSCHSGIAGATPTTPANTELTEGTTILTASTADQYATEENGSGVFTTLLVDALNGAASNLVGDVSPGSVYAHIDQSLGSWAQRPVFKTNVKSFVSLREVAPPIPLEDLQRINALFPKPGFSFALDPTFEPERNNAPADMPSPIPENTAKFAVLQKYNRVSLVVPVDAPHMWHAAMESKSCKLTVLGEHYRRLAENGRI